MSDDYEARRNKALRDESRRMEIGQLPRRPCFDGRPPVADPLAERAHREAPTPLFHPDDKPPEASQP